MEGGGAFFRSVVDMMFGLLSATDRTASYLL